MNVAATTGAFQVALVPALVPQTAGMMQIHSSVYRNSGRYPQG
jgi:putative flavoprotein involved in K+ transport